jgi:hypothetical protein
LIRSALRANHADRRVEGLLVDYLHFYGSFDRIATNRQWYRREVRVVRMGAGVRSFRDAQGFRVGPEARRIRARPTGARMFHYCLARKAEALLAKRAIDAHIYHGGLPTGGPSAAPVIPWVYGLKPYAGTHPAAAREWIAEHAQAHREVGPPQHLRDTKFIISDWIERLTGWLPFPYRNYVEV